MLTAGSLRISCTNNEQEEAQEELEIDYAGEALDVGFNITYLLDVLNNVSTEQIDSAVERIEEKLLSLGLREVASNRLGELVMRELKKLDKVAYVRFASVYRSFEDIDEFKTLVDEVRR